MGITNELRNNQETINESNNFQNNIVNEFQTVQNSSAITPFLTNSINMIMGFSTKSKEVISDYLDIILADSFKINNSSNRTRLYFRKIQSEIFYIWNKTTSNDYNEDIIEFNNLVSKYQINYSNHIDLFQIISLLCNINNDSILEIIPFYEKLLKKYEKYDKLKNKLSSKNSKKDESKKDESKKDESKKDESKKDESKKDESKKDESKKEEKKVKKPKEKIPVSVKNTLWSLHFPNVLEGKCKCCQTETITRNNFDCGHIISEKNGGYIKLENLKPICRSCNSSMGVMNMNEYMKKYGFDKIANKKMVI